MGVAAGAGLRPDLLGVLPRSLRTAANLAPGPARGLFLVVLLLARDDDHTRARRPEAETDLAEASLRIPHADRILVRDGKHHLGAAGLSRPAAYAHPRPQGD